MSDDPSQDASPGRESEGEGGPSAHKVRFVGASTPVYNCHVYVSPPDAEGQVTARIANLCDLESTAASEPAALKLLVEQFKELASRLAATGEPIRWLPQPMPPKPGDRERWIAVHL